VVKNFVTHNVLLYQKNLSFAKAKNACRSKKRTAVTPDFVVRRITSLL